MPRVNPEILRWARETAGLSLEDAAAKLSLQASRDAAGAERLAAFESGDREPTRPLLVKMAQQYRRPLLAFYLPAPPAQGERGQDFRTLPPDHSRRDDALVDALIRDIRARQRMVRALLETEDEAAPLTFVGSRTMEDGVEAVLEAIRETLSLNLSKFRNGAPGDRRASKGFAYLRERAEQAGVYVLLIGNLGSHHSSLDVQVFRGFALADPVAPFIVINDQDAETAWSFTLLHELTHIWLGQTGVSGVNAASAVEQFCNDVAGRFLLPDNEVVAEAAALRTAGFDAVLARINVIADQREVSRSMVAYKLFRQGIIDGDAWSRLSGLFRQQWLQNREARKNRAKDRDGGPNYYVVRRHKIGAKLVGLARRMVAEGALVPSKAAKILGVKPANVYSLVAVEPGRPPSRAA
jgi:Zn-dependent peptidase ImmA (M78 family)/transcriptional regulator with XRE-family HTH domain